MASTVGVMYGPWEGMWQRSAACLGLKQRQLSHVYLGSGLTLYQPSQQANITDVIYRAG